MLSLSRWFPSLRRAWKPIDFTTSTYRKLPSKQLIEEETLPNYEAAWYYPAKIGEIINGQYQIVGKLGFGITSTAWLARDLK